MNINIDRTALHLSASATVLDAIKAAGMPAEGVLAAMCGSEVLELASPIAADCTLTPLTLHDDEGRRIYERSLRFVMLLALRRLYPGQQVRIEFSAGKGGVFVRLPGICMDDAAITALENEMTAITAADEPFRRGEWTVAQAIEYFAGDGQADKVALLNRRRQPTITMYSCGGMWEYFYGAMTPSTGYVRMFGLTRYREGFVLRLPSPEHPNEATPYIDRPKHLAVFGQSAHWCSILGIQNASDLAALMDEK